MTHKLIEKRVKKASTSARTANEPTLLECIVKDRNLPLLLNDKELAALINVSPASLRKMRSEGKSKGRSDLPPHVYHGRRVRYPLDTVIKWIDTRCGATQISAKTQGFGIGKAAVGAFIAGPIGLAAGAIGSNKTKIVCLQCGNEWSPGT